MSTTTDTDTESGILTIDQAATYLSIPKATLYTWRTRRAGFGQTRIEVRWLPALPRADLDAWLVDHLETFDDASTPEQRSSGGVSLSRSSSPR